MLNFSKLICTDLEGSRLKVKMFSLLEGSTRKLSLTVVSQNQTF